MKFFENTINKIDKNYLSNYIFIMDNLHVHLTKNVLSYFKNNNIKLMFSVPYENMFNPIELKKYIIDIINSKKISSNLFLNYVEAVEKYYIFVKNNESLNLEQNQEININNINNM